MKKIIKSILIVVFFIVLVVILIFSAFVQVKFEKYIYKQQKTYGILQDRERLKYTPVLVYFLFQRDKINNWTSRSVYLNVKEEKIRGYGYGDEYIQHCYFSFEDKLEYIKKGKPLILNKTSHRLIKKQIIYFRNEHNMPFKEISK